MYLIFKDIVLLFNKSEIVSHLKNIKHSPLKGSFIKEKSDLQDLNKIIADSINLEDKAIACEESFKACYKLRSIKVRLKLISRLIYLKLTRFK